VAFAACRTVTPGAMALPPLRTRPPVPARTLMEACWPDFNVPGQKVKLTFFREGSALKDVFFESEGIPNPIGRCLQQVAWLYPWEGTFPEVLEVTPPSQRPSGWIYLAYLTLLAEQDPVGERGLLHAAPLVKACLARGHGYRKNLLFHVEPQPLRLWVYDGGRPGAEQTVTDSEHCVEAVLASTLYPITRPLDFSFPDGLGAPAAAADIEVAPYFEPSSSVSSDGQIDPLEVKERMTARQPAVSACWEAALARRPTLSGVRTLHFRVGPSGDVASSHIVANPRANPRANPGLNSSVNSSSVNSSSVSSNEDVVDYLLDVCLTQAMALFHLPSPGSSGGEFSYSWVFRHR